MRYDDMELPRYRISRQRVCQQCSTAKTKCYRSFAGSACRRCGQRGLSCSLADYKRSKKGSATPKIDEPTGEALNNSGHFKRSHLHRIATEGQPLPVSDGQLPGLVDTTERNLFSLPHQSSSSSLVLEDREALDSRSLDLICPIDADAISNRWLNPFVPTPGQKAKTYDPTVTAFIHQSLKSYASIAVHGRGIPPFVHPQQLDSGAQSSPLHTCLNIVRLFERTSVDDGTSIDILKREFERLYEGRNTSNSISGLVAFQAYLLYTLITYFWVGDSPSLSMVQLVMQLQELASIAAKLGVACAAEKQNARPGWDCWIVAEATRRTIYTMYLFDGLLSARDGTPSFLGTELQGLSAPSCQSLWASSDRRDWEREYNEFLAQWPEGYLAIDELWPTPANFDDGATQRRRHRVDHWLEEVDKFGTMLYAVTSYIHKN